MKLISPKLIITYVLLLFIFSCDVTQEIENYKNVEDETSETGNENELDGINVPNGFDFSTQKEVQITINDATTNVKYDVFAYSDGKQFVRFETFVNEEGNTQSDSVFNSGIIDKQFFNGMVKNGKLTQTITLPDHHSQLYIRRQENLKYSSEIINVSGSNINYYSNGTGKTFGKNGDLTDYLYCVNASGELFVINPLNGDYTYLSDMPMGSYTCAIDQENKMLYSIGRKKPHPLMKYSIETNSWETVANLGSCGTRLTHNSNDGLLYFSDREVLKTIDPSNGTIVNTWNIVGLSNSGIGGDIAFDSNGDIYLSSFTGVYRLELDENNDYQSVVINDNLTITPTGMTFDSNGDLWLSNKGNNAEMIIMDKESGAWEYKYGLSAQNGTTFKNDISDIALFKAPDQIENEPDSDGDGIVDRNDAFPNDAEKAFEVFTPSESGWGTFVFEDLWPHLGDYDFNDLAVRYRYISIQNAQNEVVQLDFIYNVYTVGGSFVNGFGLEIESLTPDQIESVTGLDLKHGYVNVDNNGTELGQDNAVIVMFDDARSMLSQEVKISIKFTQPIETNVLGSAPYNPFMIVNKERAKEVHLPFKNSTSLGSNIIDVEGVNSDLDGNYVTANGLPWAINVSYDFKVPNEKIRIIEAYNFFANWANSDGMSFEDWYQDKPGHINKDKVKH